MDAQLYYTVSIVFAGLAGLWGIFVWFSGQLKHTINSVLEKMDRLQEAILAKIEYHERHDDKRFENVNNELWTIKLRNAALDAARNAKHQLDKEVIG